MGIISFSSSPLLSILLAPVHAVAAWFVPAQNSAHQPGLPYDAAPLASHLQPLKPSRHPAVRGSGVHSVTTRPCGGVARPSRQSRLKIVRELDASVSASCAGRMIISGRMADVCAELDRMAMRESAAH